MEMTANYKPNVEVASDPEDLARRTVQLFIATARDAMEARGAFHVAISGGQTPGRFFDQIAGTAEARSLSWEKIHVFWVDERYVPPDSEASNYKLAAETFLNRVEIPADNVHRIPTEYDDINDAARDYERTIRRVLGLADDQMPEFDLMVLGMGRDGHTGSLLPHSYATFDTDDLVCVVYVMGSGMMNRVTLTRSVMLAARRLVVMVSGREKAPTLRDVLTGEPDEVKYPIHVLWPALDRVTWLVDREAAEGLAQ